MTKKREAEAAHLDRDETIGKEEERTLETTADEERGQGYKVAT